MSIASEIARLQQAKADLATAIENKGVTVPASATLDDYAALVDSIQQGGGLPYDAEVEYIESSGTQYFDTGIKMSNDCYIEIALNSKGSSFNVFGARAGASSKNIMISVAGNNHAYSIDFNNSNYSPYRAIITSNTNPQTKVKLVASKEVRGIYKYPDNTNIVVNSTLCPDVFTCDTNALLLNTSGSPYYSAGFKGQLFYCTIKRNGVSIMELIPVRIGQTGLLYDKVNKKLFGNQGTGSFILGADKN